MTSDGSEGAFDLDPDDWTAFRDVAHELLDHCIDALSAAAENPWRPIPERVAAGYRIEGNGGNEASVARRLVEEVLPYRTGNTHPAFFGWVHGSGLASGILSEMVAAAMNSNCGGRDHGMSYLERAVIDWARSALGFPDSASGVLVTGSSQATVIALAAARVASLGADVRRFGQQEHRLTAYACQGAHNSIRKALELMGVGGDNLRLVSESASGLDVDELRERIREDRSAGATPFAVVGSAGTVDTGRFDDLRAIAEVARGEGLWFHVDGAFGAWLRLADEPWRHLVAGIEAADSIACDFHKWMYVPYDCGLCLIRDESVHRSAFALRANYLEGQKAGLGGGEPWFCDYGVDLSRGNRALKVWVALELYGVERLGKAITMNCRQAAYMATCVGRDSRMKVMSDVQSNICVFTADASLPDEQQSDLNRRLAIDLQLAGDAVFSTTRIDGVTCLRAAITNHRTSNDVIDAAVRAITRRREELSPAD